MNMAEYLESRHVIELSDQEVETLYNALNHYVDTTDEDTHGLLMFFEDFLEDEEDENGDEETLSDPVMTMFDLTGEPKDL